MSLRPTLVLVALLVLPACDAPAVSPITAEPAARPDLPGTPAQPAPARTAEDDEWNGDEIRWLDYDAGIARARAEGKPVCLVMHADWCPHCHTYANVFSDPRVVAQSRKLVMVRVNIDHAPAVASRYALDGTYVPRTYFLRPDGTVMERIDAQRARYRYFFNERDPASILGGMTAALSPG